MNSTQNKVQSGYSQLNAAYIVCTERYVSEKIESKSNIFVSNRISKLVEICIFGIRM